MIPHARPASQTTLNDSAEAEGVALHAGVRVRVRLHPVAADEGVLFVRSDLPGSPVIRATPESVNRKALARRTELLGPGGASVATVEHLLATCLALGVDNLRVEVDGPELPIFDGSALPYVDLIARAGIRPLAHPRRILRLARPVSLVRPDAEIHAVPAGVMALSFIADLSRAGLTPQVAVLSMESDAFATHVAPARTFCYFEDIEPLRTAGLIRGGSLDCAIVIRDGLPIDSEYRLPNELACHKLLDLIGDLAILGCPVGAMVSARATGHAMHHEFIDLLRKELSE